MLHFTRSCYMQVVKKKIILSNKTNDKKIKYNSSFLLSNKKRILMSPEEISKAIKTQRKELGIGESLSFYAPAILLLLFFFFEFYRKIEGKTFGTESFYLIFKEEFELGYFCLFFAILIFFTKYISLTFSKLDIKIPQSHFHKVIEEHLKNLDWKIVSKGNAFIVAESEVIFFLSQNERITIINEESFILINSICNPDNLRALFSFGNNRENLNDFKDRLKA